MYQQVFSGTVYPEQLHKAISRDVELFVGKYNTLSPRQFTSPVGNLVAISGYMMMNVHGRQENIEMDVTLTPNFPQEQPYIVFRIPPNRISPSQGLAPNGVVNLPPVHNWIFRQSTLLKLGDDLYTYFSQNPPVLPPQPVSSNVAPVLSPYGGADQIPQTLEEAKRILSTEAQHIVDSANKVQADLANLSIQYALMKHQVAIATKATETFQQHIAMQSRSYVQDYPINPEVEADLRFKASQKAFNESVHEIKQAFSSGQLTLDVLIDEIQQFSRQHFSKVVGDRLRSYPKDDIQMQPIS